MKECPAKFEEGLDCKPNSVKKDCLVEEKHFYPSRSVFRYCMPSHFEALGDDFKAAYNVTKTQIKSTATGTLLVDMWYSSTAIFTSIAMSAVYCMLFIWVMSTFSEPLAWCSIVLVQLGLLFATFFMWTLRETTLQDKEFLLAKSGTDTKTIEEYDSTANG